MHDDRQVYQLYWQIWTTLRQTRMRNRMFAAAGGFVLAALSFFGLYIQSGPLAMTAATGSISLFWLLERGLFDGDLVARCLRLMYDRPLSRIELAIIDTQSSMHAAGSQIDRSVQQALRLYRSLNHNRLYR